jgi:hypothetical protein
VTEIELVQHFQKTFGSRLNRLLPKKPDNGKVLTKHPLKFCGRNRVNTVVIINSN